MSELAFSNEERDRIIRKIQAYFTAELDTEIGGFDAGFLLAFFTKEIGGYYYNRGLYDAQAVLQGRIEEIQDALEALEKPTETG